MQTKLIFLFLLFRILPSFGQVAQEVLFPIQENGLWGYIDSTGTVIIPFRFLSAGDFSEGLAPVRLVGRYGYISTTGEMVIPVKFDYAESFENGLGKVWLDGKPFFVDKTGKITFSQQAYAEIKGFDKGLKCGVVTTKSANMGLIDARGHLLLDTIFLDIRPWGSDRFIAVYRDSSLQLPWPSPRFPSEIKGVAVFNDKGQRLVPPGKYRQIWPKSPTEAEVQLLIDSSANPQLRYIDRNGHFLHLFSDKCYHYLDDISEWSEGRIAVEICSKPSNELNKNDKQPDKSLYGWLCTDGRLIIPDSAAESVFSFSEGRAFVCYGTYRKYYRIFDRNGHPVSDRVFSQVMTIPSKRYFDYGFVNGAAIVVSDSGFVELIDTLGRTIKRLPKEIGRTWMYPLGSLWVFQSPGTYGFWDPQSNSITKSMRFLDLDFGVRGGLVRGLDYSNSLIYFNTRGELVWKQQKIAAKHRKLCTDSRLYGFYGIKNLQIEQVLSGIAHPLGEMEQFPDDSFTLVIRMGDTTTYLGEFEAAKCFLVNRSCDTLFSWHLRPDLQARDAHGNWKSLVSEPIIFCQSGRSMQYLAPDERMIFPVPVFEGEFQTLLRAVMIVPSRQGHNNIALISNTIPVRINPGQFWRPPDYYNETGILRPYIGELFRPYQSSN